MARSKIQRHIIASLRNKHHHILQEKEARFTYCQTTFTYKNPKGDVVNDETLFHVKGKTFRALLEKNILKLDDTMSKDDKHFNYYILNAKA